MHFRLSLPNYLLKMTRKNQNLSKTKQKQKHLSKTNQKHLRISPFYTCTKNYNHMIYGSWDKVCDGQMEGWTDREKGGQTDIKSDI